MIFIAISVKNVILIKLRYLTTVMTLLSIVRNIYRIHWDLYSV